MVSSNYGGFQIAPGGDVVLYRADQDEDEVYELYGSLLTRAARPASTPSRSVSR